MLLKQSSFNNNIMSIAIAEAKIASEKGEVPVGCVIINRFSKKIISKSHNFVQQSNNPNLHAEILAINKACKILNSKNLSNHDIYVTLEPCTMCASAISNARLDRIYYAAQDKKQGAIENGVRFFTSKTCFYRPEIYPDIQEQESKQLLKKFFHTIRSC